MIVILGSKKTHGFATQVLLPPPSLRMKGRIFLGHAARKSPIGTSA
jgi:hypothetical protein